MSAESLEARLARLEEIVRRLEGDELELDDALRLFEEAVGHLRETEELLEQAQLRVDELVGTLERPRLRKVESGYDDDPVEDGEPSDEP